MTARSLREIRAANPYPCTRMSLRGPGPVVSNYTHREILQRITCDSLQPPSSRNLREVRVQPKHLAALHVAQQQGAA